MPRANARVSHTDEARGRLFRRPSRRSALAARLPRKNGAAGELARFDLTIWALIYAGCDSNALRSQSEPPLPRSAAGRVLTNFGTIRLQAHPRSG